METALFILLVIAAVFGFLLFSRGGDSPAQQRVAITSALVLRPRFPIGRILVGFLLLSIAINVSGLVSVAMSKTLMDTGGQWWLPYFILGIWVVGLIVAAGLSMPKGYWNRWKAPARVSVPEKICDFLAGMCVSFWGLCHLSILLAQL